MMHYTTTEVLVTDDGHPAAQAYCESAPCEWRGAQFRLDDLTPEEVVDQLRDALSEAVVHGNS